MALTYTNVYNDYILEPLREIFRIEFASLKMYMDRDYRERGAKWLNLIPIGEANVSIRSKSQLTEYAANLRYYQFHTVERDRGWYRDMTEIVEQFKRLLANKSNFTVLGTWVNQNGTWGSTTTVWSAALDTYCWHDMQVTINYNPELSEAEEAVGKKLSVVEINLTFKHEEVYA